MQSGVWSCRVALAAAWILVSCGGNAGSADGGGGTGGGAGGAGGSGGDVGHAAAIANGTYLLRFELGSACAPGPDHFLIQFDQGYLHSTGACAADVGAAVVPITEVRHGLDASGYAGGIYRDYGQLGSIAAAQATEADEYFYALCWAVSDTAPLTNVRYNIGQEVIPPSAGGGLYGLEFRNYSYSGGYINEGETDASDASDGTTRRWLTTSSTLEVFEDQGSPTTVHPGRFFTTADPGAGETTLECITD